ncbi:MAG: radical SAM protein [Planctomycetes bacterium]|nr:radical SAM protein [Planctomycetota bacterium]
MPALPAPALSPDPARIEAWCGDWIEGRGAPWLLGGEAGTQSRGEWDAASPRVLIVRLSTYRDVADSMTHPLLGQLAREVEGTFVDYAYLPPPAEYAAMLEAGIPPLFGTTTKRHAAAFDLLGISNSIAQELLNLPLLLAASGIPLRKRERLAQESAPFLVLGGANASATSVLHGLEPGASLLDGVVVGEGEGAWPLLLRILREVRAAGGGKEAVLARWRESVPGFYEADRYIHRFSGGRLVAIEKADPSAPLPLRKNLLPRLAGVRTLEEGFIPFDAEAAGVASVEIDRGCPANCSFCREGWELKPYRERSVEDLLGSIRRAKEAQGLHTVNLFSLNFNMHGGFHALVPAAAREVARVAMKSQRFDILAHDPEMASVEAAAGKTSVTCGLEGISERLRAFLQKTLPTSDVVEACRRLGRTGSLRELKVFTIVTGLEEEADFAEFDRLLGDVAAALGGSRAEAGRSRLIVNVTPLVAMPNTPSQFLPTRSIPPERDPVVRRLAGISRSRGAEFRCAVAEGENEVSAYLLRGDRRLQSALLASSLEDRFVYYGRIPNAVARRFRERIEALGIDPTLFTGPAAPADCLPWSDISTGVAPAYVLLTARASEKSKDLGYCLDRPGARGHCTKCDACEEPFQIRAIVRRQIAPPPPSGWERESLARRPAGAVRIAVRLEPAAAAVPREAIAATLARAILRADSSLVPRYVRPGRWAPALPRLHGLLLVDLLFAPAVEPSRIEALLQPAGTGVEWCAFAGVADETRPVAAWRVAISTKGDPLPAVRAFLRLGAFKHEERRREEGGRLFRVHPGSGKARDLVSVEVTGEGRAIAVASEDFAWPAFARALGGRGAPESLEALLEASLCGSGAGAIP